MLYHRRKILLSIIETFGGHLSAKQLQKYLFLFTRKQTEKSYDFIPYYYGCFSFQANQDIITLSKLGYLSIVENQNGRLIQLQRNDNYISLLDMFEQQMLKDLKSEFGKMNQNDLIKYTYIRYPFFATKSIIAKSLLNEQELASIEKQKRTYSSPQLFTIGYEGISLETYINKLIINDVRILCDVRKNAISQKYGFSKSQLEKACKGVGIHYIHIPQLGINSDQRQDLNTQRDYDILFDLYEKTTIKENQQSLLYIRSLIDKEQRIALTCFEANPKQCHRSRVAKHLMLLPNIDYDLKHL
ncbi:MAG: DUF488 domain-containing protein [Bacteroides sp.]|nr:DUF488 domain-containing protein [Bacteroides sp.]